MYSKFGKVLAERFQILNHRDEILSGKVKKIKPPPTFSRNRPRIASYDITEEIPIIDDSEKESSVSPPATEIKKNTCSFLSQSRNDFYKATDHKKFSPPCGQYDCKYALVEKRIKAPKFKPRPPTKSRRKKCQSISDFEVPPEKVRTKIQSPIPFDKQQGRSVMKAYAKDVNESRFVKFDDMPEQYSKYRRVSTPNLGKGSERKKLFREVDQSPDYKPSFKLVTPDIGKVTNFEKYSSRKNEGSSFRDDTRQYNPNYAFVEKRVCAPDFAKASSRPTSATPLPCFMKSVNWRGAIDLMNEKSLEMNYYIDKESIYNSILA